jgi:hypothetical protein
MKAKMAAVRTTAYSERRRGALEVEAISPVMARLRFNLSRLQRESDAIQNLPYLLVGERSDLLPGDARTVQF